MLIYENNVNLYENNVNLYENNVNLIAVSKTTHTRHDTKDIVVDSIDFVNTGIRTENKLSIVNAREVTCARWLVFFGFEGERVYIDPLSHLGGTGLGD